MKPEFLRQIFEKKFSNIKFYKNSFSGSRSVPSEQTDRHDKGNSLFSQYSERT